MVQKYEKVCKRPKIGLLFLSFQKKDVSLQIGLIDTTENNKNITIWNTISEPLNRNGRSDG
jgi:hypothetical protein